MRRYALAIPLAYLAAAVACGSFDADETGGSSSSSSSSGGPTADASLDGQGSSGALPDGGGLPACKSSHFEDDFADAGASGWKTVSVGDAAITYPTKGGVSILLNGTEQRGYLELDQPETPCGQNWTYSLSFDVKIQDRDHVVAGPVLGGIQTGERASSGRRSAGTAVGSRSATCRTVSTSSSFASRPARTRPGPRTATARSASAPTRAPRRARSSPSRCRRRSSGRSSASPSRAPGAGRTSTSTTR